MIKALSEYLVEQFKYVNVHMNELLWPRDLAGENQFYIYDRGRSETVLKLHLKDKCASFEHHNFLYSYEYCEPEFPDNLTIDLMAVLSDKIPNRTGRIQY